MSEHGQDESELLRRIAAGEQYALDILYARYRSRLARYLVRHLNGNVEWAEEIVQEVFLSVWMSARNFRNEASPAAWIFAIARHQLMKAQRTQARHPEHQMVQPLMEWADAPEEHTSMASHHPDDVIIERLVMVEAFAQLSPKHREILELAFHYGFAVGEIAHILGVPIGTVKSRMSYARQALQHALQVAHQEEPSA